MIEYVIAHTSSEAIETYCATPGEGSKWWVVRELWVGGSVDDPTSGDWDGGSIVKKFDTEAEAEEWINANREL